MSWIQTRPGGGSGGISTADNGLTLTGSNVQLGGSLVQDTDINGGNDYVLNILDMQASVFSGISANGVFSALGHSDGILGLTGSDGSGLFSGNGTDYASSTIGSGIFVGKGISQFFGQFFSYSPDFSVTSTQNAITGSFDYVVSDIANNFEGGLYSDTGTMTRLYSSNNSDSIQEVRVSHSDNTIRLFNQATALDAIFSKADRNKPQQTAFNWDSGVLPTSTVTHNGSFASNVLTITSALSSYTVDSTNPLVPDNIIIADTGTAGDLIRIIMPLASDFPGRVIGVINGGARNPIEHPTVVTFPGSDFFNGNSNDYIMASANEVKYYKSVLSLGVYNWQVIQHSAPTNFSIQIDYGVTVDLTTGVDAPNKCYATDRSSFGFGLNAGSGPSTVLLPLAGVMRVGQEIIVYDARLLASSNNITIDAGSGNVIGNGVSYVQSKVISVDGASYTLRLISDDGTKTYWKLI